MFTADENNQRKVEIVYQDQALAIINKPAGLVVLRSAPVKGKTLEDWVRSNLQSSFNLRHFRAGIVHRLDKETRGLILVAKSQPVFDYLQEQFKQRKVKKTYWALVRGKPPQEGEIVAPIGRAPGRRLKFLVVPGGKPAKTSYQVIKSVMIGSEEYTLLVVWPETGRTHQIRVHLRYLGHPIFGDSVYGGRKERGRPMFLVAKAISFLHPQTGKRMKFEIDLAKELKDFLKS